MVSQKAKTGAIAFGCLVLSLHSASLFAGGAKKEEHRPFSEMQGECGNYEAHLKTEFAAWEAPAIPIAAGAKSDGSAVLPIGKKAELALSDQGKVSFMLQPEKTFPVKGKAHAGLVRFSVPKDGTYRVSLGAKIWVDLVDSATSKAVDASKFEMQTQCETIFKTVEFPLKAGRNYWLQISSSRDPKARILVSQVTQT